MTRSGTLERTADPSGLADRPLGPVFESTFDVGTQVVHVLVVRGSPELLEEARARASELLELWQESDDELDHLLLAAGDVADAADSVPVAPESLVLDHVTRAADRGVVTADRRALLRAVAPALVADLVARDLVEGGALGACVRVGNHASMTGVPPRLTGWRVEVPDGSPGQTRQLLVVEGGVSSAGHGRTSATAQTAWQAALELEHARQASVIRSGAE